MPSEDIDFFPFGDPPPPVRVDTRKAGPRSLNRSDAAVAERDNAEARRKPRPSRSKVAR